MSRPTIFSVGDEVELPGGSFECDGGAASYQYAVVSSVHPFKLESPDREYQWVTYKPEDLIPRTNLVQTPVIDNGRLADKPVHPSYLRFRECEQSLGGLTLREYYSGIALDAIIRSGIKVPQREEYADHAVSIADLLIERLERDPDAPDDKE